MEMDYLLTPAGKGARFDEETLALMRAFWKDDPYYVRGDGAYIICLNAEVVDYVFRYRSRDSTNASSTAILFRPESVLISSMGWPELDARTAEFVEWCQQRWPCEFYLATGEPATMTILRHD